MNENKNYSKLLRLIVSTLLTCCIGSQYTDSVVTAEMPLADSEPRIYGSETSSTIPVTDKRIAAVWLRDASLDNFGPGKGANLSRVCTANHVGNNWWITAKHCFGSDGGAPKGYLRNDSGVMAGIEEVHRSTDSSDLAIIRTRDALVSDSFEVKRDRISVGSTATLIGYARPHDFASTTEVTVNGYVDSYSFNGTTLSNLIHSTSNDGSFSCSGDSGGAVYIGNTLYAIHSGGYYNFKCQGSHKTQMWHTELTHYVDWIENVTSV